MCLEKKVSDWIFQVNFSSDCAQGSWTLCVRLPPKCTKDVKRKTKKFKKSVTAVQHPHPLLLVGPVTKANLNMDSSNQGQYSNPCTLCKFQQQHPTPCNLPVPSCQFEEMFRYEMLRMVNFSTVPISVLCWADDLVLFCTHVYVEQKLQNLSCDFCELFAFAERMLKWVEEL